MACMVGRPHICSCVGLLCELLLNILFLKRVLTRVMRLVTRRGLLMRCC